MFRSCSLNKMPQTPAKGLQFQFQFQIQAKEKKTCRPRLRVERI